MSTVLAVSLVASFLASLGQPSVQPSDCVRALADGVGPVASELCQAEAQLQLANGEPKRSREQLRFLQRAAQHLQRAANLAVDAEVKYRALDKLAQLYDPEHLDEPRDMDGALRDLIALRPDDMSPVRRLAKLLEDRGFIDAAEDVLLSARRRQPDALQPYQMLAQFYIRRAGAIQRETDALKPKPVTAAGEPDEKGIYRVGGDIKPPARQGVPQYPEQARAAQIEGAVLVDIVVDQAGVVADAQVVRSIPLLDDAALQAVREWRFTPTLVNGQSVPVRMTVTVNFTNR